MKGKYFLDILVKVRASAPCRHNEVTRRLHRATRVPLCCHWSAEVRGEARGRRDARWGWKQVGWPCGTYCRNTALQQRPTMLFFMEKKVLNSIFVLKICYQMFNMFMLAEVLSNHPPNQYKSEHESDKSKPVHNLALLSTNGHCRVE